MELRDVQALLWVVQHGSLQGASRAEGVSRTTLRRRLDNLQKVAGVPIVHLNGHSVSLTAAGKVLVDHGPVLLAQREGLLKRARAALSAPQGELRILLGLGFPPMLIARLMSLCLQGSPGIQASLRIVEEPLKVTRHDYDLLIYWGDALPDRQGYSRVFLRAQMLLMASPEYISEHGVPASLDELKDHRAIQLLGDAPSLPLRDGRRFPVTPMHQANDLYVLGCMVGAGIGIGMMPRNGLHVDPAFAHLQPVLSDQIGAHRTARFFAPVKTSYGGPAAAAVRQLDMIADMVAAAS